MKWWQLSDACCKLMNEKLREEKNEAIGRGMDRDREIIITLETSDVTVGCPVLDLPIYLNKEL